MYFRSFDISDNMQSSKHDKSSSILQLLKNKSKDLQKLITYFNRTINSATNVFQLAGVLRDTFALCLKDLLVVVLLLFIL